MASPLSVLKFHHPPRLPQLHLAYHQHRSCAHGVAEVCVVFGFLGTSICQRTPLHHSRGTGDADFSLPWCMDGPGTCHRGVDKIRETASPIKAQVDEELNATRPSLPLMVSSFLHGKAAEPSPTTWCEVHNPATNELVARVPQSTLEEMRAAVDSAKATFKAWRDKPITARQRVMLHLARLVQDNSETRAEISTQQQRNAIADAKEDVFRGLAENGCDMASLHTGESSEGVARTWTATPFASLWVTAVASLPATSPP